MRAVLSILVALASAAALLCSLFLYTAIGMAVSERAANLFGTCVLVVVVLLGGARRSATDLIAAAG